MVRRATWVAALFAVVMTLPLEAEAKDPRPVFEMGYDGLIMAGEDVKFQDPLYGGSLGLMLYMPMRNPFLMRMRVNLQGAGWAHMSGKDGHRLVSGFKYSVGLGLGRGRNVLPFVEVGLGPQFLTMYLDGSRKVSNWAWTVGIEGQLGFIFRIRKMFGIRLAFGFSSLSFYSRKENLGGLWITSSLLFGLPGPDGSYHYPHEPPLPPEPPPPSHQPAYATGFYFDAWITNASPDGTRPVLHARLYREGEFDAEVDVSLELADGSAWEMHREGLEDPDLFTIPLYILGIECGGQSATVKGKSGWTERTYPVHVYIPCPVMPEGM